MHLRAACVSLSFYWSLPNILSTRTLQPLLPRCVATRMSASDKGASAGGGGGSAGGVHTDCIPLPGEDAHTAGRDGLAPWQPSEGVSIPRPDELRAKLEGFSLGDTHVVADFDFTLTRYWLDKHGGRKGLSSHLLVQRYGRLLCMMLQSLVLMSTE